MTGGVLPSVTDALHMLGASHECLGDHELSRIAIPPEVARRVGRALRAHGVPCVVLATCHRLEVYWEGTGDGAAHVRDVVARKGGIAATDLRERREGENAMRHLMAVASGARSLRPGEPEILGQLRNAWQVARADNTTSTVLDLHLQAAIAAARHLRRRLEVEPPQTIGQATVALLAQSLQRQVLRAECGESLRVLVLGAGAVGRSVTLAISAARGAALPSRLSLDVTNRTEANAARLAAAAGASVTPWSSWPEQLAQADVLICSARTSHALLTAAHATDVARARRESAMWIDLGAPPNIAADASSSRVCRRTGHDLPGASNGATWRLTIDNALADELRRFRASLARRRSWRADVSGRGIDHDTRAAVIATG